VPAGIKPGNGVSDGIIEVLITVASFLHPNAETIDALDPQERARWVAFQDAVVKGHYSIKELLQLLKEVIREQSNADIEEKKQLADERGKLFFQRLTELSTNHEESRRERKRILDLITFCVVALVLCACLTAVFAQPWVVAGVGACTALVAAIGVLTRLRAQVIANDPPHGFP
jgi:hypothetical protein